MENTKNILIMENKTKTEILLQLGLHKYYNTLGSVTMVQNKLYLLKELTFVDLNFSLQKTGPFSRELVDFVENTYIHYVDSTKPPLCKFLIEKIDVINRIKEDKLTSMLGEKETYKLLASMCYIKNNDDFWRENCIGSYERCNKKIETKEFVYNILEKKENIYSQRTLDLAWELLLSL